jgi:hypothetical protein
MWTPDDPAKKKYISYSGEFPKRLYRYRSVNHANLESRIKFEVLEEAVYLAGLGELNDPDEGRFAITFGGGYEKVLQYWRLAIASADPAQPADQAEASAKSNTDELARTGYAVPDRVISHTRNMLEQVVRVACFTTQPANYSMWANYAKYTDEAGRVHDHAGICIEYLCDESWRSTTLHPVQYTDVVPQINVVANVESDLVRAMYTKALEWRCEEEWRITSVIDARPPFPANLTANSKFKVQNAVVGVIFGLKTPDSLVNTFRSGIGPHMPNIRFKKVVRDIRTFERKIVDI